MGFTPKTRIQEGGLDEHLAYNDMMQITEYDMRTVGTKSLRSSMTKSGNQGGKTTDKKNEIDDSKTVK